MSCDGLTLQSTVPTLTLSSSAPALSLSSSGAEVTLTSDSCVLSLPVDATLTFAVATTSLSLESQTTEICLTTPVPVATGEANTGANVGTGVGIYDGKTGTTLNFRTLRSLTPELLITENAVDQRVEFDHRDGFAANCSAGDAVGDPVYITGETSGTLDVAPVDISDPGKVPCRGIIDSKDSPTECFVRVCGVVDGLAGLAQGTRLFAGTGALNTAPPTGSGEFVQAVGVAVSTTAMYVDLSGQLMRRAI